ncbi:MAG TPA: TIGR03936 family radical SAM-associated protein [Anaerolineae bacterium]|nr:TIGR03936 family radical SAM-associated protein [Anaerolineae bacterium]
MTDPNQPPPDYRLRLIFAKKKQIKYIGHLDLVLAWERALRRAQIPLTYSKGFNPHPKIQVASSLPLGTTGSAEIMDIIVTRPVAPTEALECIRSALPEGIELHAVEEIPLKAPTLQHLLRQAEYRVIVETELSADEITYRIETLLATEQVMQTRQRKKQLEEFDLRPWLHELALEALAGGEACLHMRLTAGQFGNLRPEEVLKALGLGDNWAEIERTRLIFDQAE